MEPEAIPMPQPSKNAETAPAPLVATKCFKNRLRARLIRICVQSRLSVRNRE